MEHLLWKILETVGLLLFVVCMIATALIHTIGYIRFMVGRLRAEEKAVRCLGGSTAKPSDTVR